jgi:hypothetical protein
MLRFLIGREPTFDVVSFVASGLVLVAAFLLVAALVFAAELHFIGWRATGR